MRAVALALAALALPAAAREPAMPSLLSDLPGDVAAAARAAPSKTAGELLERVFKAGDGYVFHGGGVTATTDRRWFEGPTVEGTGAPFLELRRWPGDTVLAFYALPPQGAPGLPGLDVTGSAREEAGWSVREATLATPLGRRSVLWGERVDGTRRVGALGAAGDAGLGPGAVAGLKEEILAVLRRATIAPEGPAPPSSLLAPELGADPKAAKESDDGWQVFRGPGFTLGLPPGIRAIRLDLGIDPPRPLAGASVWLRGRFEDRDGDEVVVGDGRHAGYVAKIPSPAPGWTLGSAPPIGAPSAKRIDGAPLADLVLSWTGASKASVAHYKEAGFRGDWLVFRLLVAGSGIEIGLPVLESWRSLALFWIPVAWRPEGRAPAPPPIEPAASRGIRFHRYGERDRTRLLEGELFVADLRLEIPRGVWPVADLSSANGLPVTFVDASGKHLGRLVALAPGAPELAPSTGEGWSAQKRPRSRGASHVWTRPDGSAVLVAPDGHGFAFEPSSDLADPRGAWERLYQSASFTKRRSR